MKMSLVIPEFEGPPIKCTGISCGGCEHFAGFEYKQMLIRCWLDNRVFKKKLPQPAKKWHGHERRH